MNNRPNILFVMCDQLSALHTSPYGNEAVKTPVLQSLADRGTVFDHNYCNAPLCAPSRASMVSGQLASEIPVNDNAEELPASTPTFMHHLRRGGYATCLSGKMHFVGPDQLHGFEERLTTDIYPADFSWTQWWEDSPGPLRRMQNPDLGGRPQVMRHMGEMVKTAGPVSWSYQADYDEMVLQKALERIRKWGRRKSPNAEQPWFLCVSFTQPHDPYSPDKEHWDLYDDVDIPMPNDAPPEYDRHITDVWNRTWHGIDELNPTSDDVYRVRRGYYGMISYIDDKLGQLLNELDRNQFVNNTIVIFTSDHGDMVGEHGLFFKRTFREGASRVPLVIAGPGIPEGRHISSPSSLVDLAPTVIDLAGLEPSNEGFVPRFSGTSLTQVMRDESVEPERPVIIENFGEATRKPTRAIVHGRLKYVYLPHEDELLFDLATDPEEWVNLAGRSEYWGDLQRMRAICMDRWDEATTTRKIVASQRKRTFLRQALSQGTAHSWDYQPRVDASRMYVRSQHAFPEDRSILDQFDGTAGGQ